MRRILFDRSGTPQHYLTGAGVLYNLENHPVGAVQAGEPGSVLNTEGRVVGWFSDGFVWDESGVLAFVKGVKSQDGLQLPKTAPLRVPLSPTPAPLYPLLVRTEPPPLRWVWSDKSLADALAMGRRV